MFVTSTTSDAHRCCLCCAQAGSAQAFTPAMDESFVQKLTKIEHTLQVSTHERLEWLHSVAGHREPAQTKTFKFGRSRDNTMLSNSSVDVDNNTLKCRLSQQASGACNASEQERRAFVEHYKSSG